MTMLRYASNQCCIIGDTVAWGPRTGIVVAIIQSNTDLPSTMKTRGKVSSKFPRLVVQLENGKLMTPFPGSVRLVKRIPCLVDYGGLPPR